MILSEQAILLTTRKISIISILKLNCKIINFDSYFILILVSITHLKHIIDNGFSIQFCIIK